MSSTRFSLTNTWTDNSVRQRGQRMKCITVSMLGFLVFTILLAYLAFGDEDSGGKPVIKVVYVIFRHGDRNPTEVYPTDPYSDPKFWPGGWGALTNEGKLQMYNLGTYLRSRYTDVLEELYSPEHLLVRSSYADRCMMSAGALLASLQPPSASEIWLPGLNWQPIPVHSVPRSLDQLIVVKKHCPRYEKELEEANQSEEVSKLESENKNLYQYLSSHSGKKISSILDVEFLYNTLEIEKAKGFQLPEWTKEVFPEPMKKIATVSLGIFTQNAIMKRLMGGPLLNDIKEKMIESSRSNLVKKPKVFLIAAHDITVVNVMRSLGIVEALKPDFGASLLFELHTGPPGFGDDFVKVFYMNSSSTTQPTPLLLPGCQELCPLSDFVSVAATLAVTPSDWENICST